MVRGLKQTSSTIAIGFSATETLPNTFEQASVDLNLSPLDNEVFVVLAIDLNPFTPDAIPATDTAVRCSVTTTSQVAQVSLADSNCLAVAETHIKAAGFADAGVGFQTTGMETPPANLEFIGIIATNDFFIQVKGEGNINSRGVNGKMYGFRARADASIYSALVQSEVLSA